jgi:hypothetical protein
MTKRRSALSIVATLLWVFLAAPSAPPAMQLDDPDTTPPSITPSVAGTSGANGWYTSAVGVSWTVSDPESGIAASSGCDPTTLSSDTAGATVTCTATNGQGLSSEASVVVKIDTTAPTATAEPTSKPSAKGWYTQPVTIAFSGADPISGIATCSPSVVFGGPDTKSASATGSCINGAGLATTATATFKYDSSRPSVSPSVSGQQGANGWYTGDVSIAWSVADPQSDIDSSSGCDATVVKTDTAGTTLTCSATNDAGLTAQQSVTVRIDRTPPDTTIGGGPTGTVTTPDASFAFSASESGASFACSLDGGGFQPCSSSQSYTGLADGAHSFQVRAIDGAGNPDPTPAARSWTVRATAPTLHLPTAQVVEAVSARGSAVNYSVTADSGGEPLPPNAIACDPLSGSTFPLGLTTVACRATNQYGVSASGSFTIKVVDTTSPRLTVPAPLHFAAPGPLPASNPTISAFLKGARAVDMVDPNPTLASDAPATFPLGTTTIKFTARDASGNATSATSSLTIELGSTGSSPSGGSTSPTTPDRTPPGDVRSVQATTGDRAVTLSWKEPPDSDFHHVEIFRALTADSIETRVYTGDATRLVDRGLENGKQYRYVLVAVDKAGNRAGGVLVTATPQAVLLLAPRDGARLSRPPVLAWARIAEASYYNVQLWRGSIKILSAWPTKTRLTLARRWQYGGRRFSLTPGTYRWYVWPGLGARADKSYGPVLGVRMFTIVASAGR